MMTVRWTGVLGDLVQGGSMVTVKTKALQAGTIVMLRRAPRSPLELMLNLSIGNAPERFRRGGHACASPRAVTRMSLLKSFM